jgi:hypothetical protein
MSAAEEKPKVFLESDDEIRGQKYVCLSFLSPDRGILRDKRHFFFSRFLEFYAMDYKIRATESFVLGELRKVQDSLSNIEMAIANADITDVSGTLQKRDELVEQISKMRGELTQMTSADVEKHVKENIADYRESTIVESFEKYMLVNRQKLEDEFHKQKEFQTTMHGLKVRGVYSTHEQAVARAKALHKKDPYFNVYVADMGEWLPWDPEPEEIADQEYSNDDLNKLMKAYRENSAKKDAFFEEEKRQKLAEAAAAAEAAKKSIADGKPSDIFDGPADLALQRKQERETISHG